MARKAAARYGLAPPGRNGSGLAARCSTTVLLFALAFAPAAFGAAAPMPDRVANPQPDAAAGQSRALAAQHQRIAVVATHRTATVLRVHRQRAESGSSVSAGVLFAAGTLLLLFVGAAVSVLRLSVRMSGDTSARRLLRL